MQSIKTPRGIDYLKNGILGRDRVVLAQAITLIESTLPGDLELASKLLQDLTRHSGNSMRIGITGSPGVGKSTFIEKFGLHAISQGKQLAVLTVDPTSPRTGGSILGDKTRMENLSKHPKAFIRPSPSGSVLGGVANKTRETLLLCEAAGFDLILIETVGVGQSETQVRNMVDFFLLLLLPGGGDELQGIKKGIVELADGLVITKADGDNVARAKRTQADFNHALHILNSGDKPTPPVLTASAMTGEGINDIWSTIAHFFARTSASGEAHQLRQQQDLHWFDEQFDFLLKQRLTNSSEFQNRVAELKDKIANRSISPSAAARELIGWIIPTPKVPGTKT